MFLYLVTKLNINYSLNNTNSDKNKIVLNNTYELAANNTSIEKFEQTPEIKECKTEMQQMSLEEACKATDSNLSKKYSRLYNCIQSATEKTLEQYLESYNTLNEYWRTNKNLPNVAKYFWDKCNMTKSVMNLLNATTDQIQKLPTQVYSSSIDPSTVEIDIYELLNKVNVTLCNLYESNHDYYHTQCYTQLC